ncbi:hypothetical protein [Polaromonas vacuolata]
MKKQAIYGEYFATREQTKWVIFEHIDFFIKIVSACI